MLNHQKKLQNNFYKNLHRNDKRVSVISLIFLEVMKNSLINQMELIILKENITS